MSSSDDSDTDQEIICQILRESRISTKKSLQTLTLNEGPSTSSSGELIGDKKNIETVSKIGSWRKQKSKSKKKSKNKKEKKTKMRNNSQSSKNANFIVETKTDSSPPRPETSESFSENMKSIVPYSRLLQPSTLYGNELIGDEKDVETPLKTGSLIKQKPESEKKSKNKNKKKMKNNFQSQRNSDSIVEARPDSSSPCSETSESFFEKKKSIVSNMYVRMIDRSTDSPIGELMKKRMEESLLFHTRYHRMDVVHIVLIICKIIDEDWKTIRKWSLHPETRLSWKIVENFMEKYHNPTEIAHTYPWINFNDRDYFRQFHYYNNSVLCDVLAEMSVELSGGQFKPYWY